MLAQRWNMKNRRVIILSETTDEPLTFSGMMCGVCWGGDVSDHEKNFKRGLDCLKSGHGRVLEFPQIYMILDGWSAKVIREFYTHIIDVTRLQESTRYVNYENFKYITPPTIASNSPALAIYDKAIKNIQEAMTELDKLGIPKEDYSGLLPLNYETKIVCRIGLRELINMSEQRMCSRAYHEYRDLMKEIIEALSIYSDEWKYLIEEEDIFAPKCKKLNYCPERYGCGRYPKKEDTNA
jgi:thymidylate synthase (FAD)